MVDARAFLQVVALQDIGKSIYTIWGVVSEIWGKVTCRRLPVLPYVLRFKEPCPEYEYVWLVIEFSKKTRDSPSLSATDIQVLPLPSRGSRVLGVSHFKQEPDKVQHPKLLEAFLVPICPPSLTPHEKQQSVSSPPVALRTQSPVPSCSGATLCLMLIATCRSCWLFLGRSRRKRMDLKERPSNDSDGVDKPSNPKQALRDLGQGASGRGVGQLCDCRHCHAE